jgi:hypothetical protein
MKITKEAQAESCSAALKCRELPRGIQFDIEDMGSYINEVNRYYYLLLNTKDILIMKDILLIYFYNNPAVLHLKK